MREGLSSSLKDESLGLVLVPGISSRPDLFDKLEQSLDFSSVRVEAWGGADNLEVMNLSELPELLDESIILLEEHGCESIGIVRK